jgi:thiol-disulfide isomerase/thioredoxin
MIDIDKYPEIKNKYRVSKIPTSITLKDDKEIERVIGFNSSYKNWIRNIEK